MQLEYMMVYQQNGLPIFSKCFKGFCAISAQDPALLSGFLTALQSFSAQLIPSSESTASSLEAIKMGPTVMRFSRVLPSGHNVLLGLSEDSPSLAKEIFDGVEKFVQIYYQDINWSIITTTQGEEFGRRIVEEVLSPLFHKKGGWTDTCPLGDSCAMKALPTNYHQKVSIWETIKQTYRKLWRRKGMDHTI
jgi:hypothetical protein